MGLLVKDSNPYYAPPAFIILEKNGKWRMVVDLCHLNDLVEMNAGRFPTWGSARMAVRALDILSCLMRSQVLFGVDGMLAAPMGFVNTPFIYQERIVQEILGGVENDSSFRRPQARVLQWLEDCLAHSETFEQHLATNGQAPQKL